MDHEVTQETFWNNRNVLYFETGVVLSRYLFIRIHPLYTENEGILLYVNDTSIK